MSTDKSSIDPQNVPDLEMQLRALIQTAAASRQLLTQALQENAQLTRRNAELIQERIQKEQDLFAAQARIQTLEQLIDEIEREKRSIESELENRRGF